MLGELRRPGSPGHLAASSADHAGQVVARAVTLAGVALVAIVSAAVTSSFVARAEAQRGAEDATEDDLAAQRLDSFRTSPRGWAGSSGCSAHSASNRVVLVVADAQTSRFIHAG